MLTLTGMTIMKTHKLKSWPQYFHYLIGNVKSFDVRINDRDFCIGDHILFEEWDPEKQEYTGRVLLRKVTYMMLGGKFGLEKNAVVMALKML